MLVLGVHMFTADISALLITTYILKPVCTALAVIHCEVDKWYSRNVSGLAGVRMNVL